MSAARPLDAMAVPLRGLTLIEASAGTGKTYTIANLYLRLVVEQGLTVDEILVVTFTEAATAELQARVRRRLRAALDAAHGRGDDGEVTTLTGRVGRATVRRRLQIALADFDEAAISTIHGFCRRMLQENAFESGVPFDIELEADQGPLVEELLADFWAREVAGADPLWVSELRARKVTADSLADLLGAAISSPDTAVIPEEVEPVDGPAVYRAAYATARTAWLPHRDAVVGDLLGSPALSRSRYRRPTMEALVADIDRFFADPTPQDTALPKNLDRLTPDALARGTKKNQDPPSSPFFAACPPLLETRGTFDRQLLHLRRRLVDYARAEAGPRKAERNCLSFDDLLHRLDGALAGPGGDRLAHAIHRRYRAALIDEFQDTDPVQYRIFRAIYGGRREPLFLIGDPKQSIYKFRGADVFAYLRAVTDAGDRGYTLGVNWRSDPTLIRAVNGLFGRGERPFVFERIEFGPVAARPGSVDRLEIGGRTPPPLQIRFVPRDGSPGRPGKSNAITGDYSGAALFDDVAADIARLLSSGAALRGTDGEDRRDIRAGDVAVLVRTNLQAAATQRALRRLRIPSVLRSQESVLESPEAGELLTLLRAVHEPGDGGRVRAALATPLLGLSGDRIAALRDDDRGWEAWTAAVRRWREVWVDDGFIQLFRRVLDARIVAGGPPTHARLLASVDGERRTTNLLHLAELIHQAETRGRLGCAGVLRWLARQMADPGRSADAAELRLESDELAVQLVTIHKSKGLQYPVVYCPFLWKRRPVDPRDPFSFHDPTRGERAVLDLGSEDLATHHALAERESLAEDQRLLYVALTRAEHLCVTVWGGFTNAGSSPLGYLLHRPPGVTDPSQLDAHVRAMDDDQLRAELDRIAADSGGAIGVEDLPDGPGTPLEFVGAGADPLSARAVRRSLRLPWWPSSFSRMAASEEALTPEEADGRDHDRSAAGAGPARTGGETGERVLLWEFPRGARPGSCIHEIYEDLDFQAPDDLAELVPVKLGRFGLSADRWGEVLERAIRDSLVTPLDREASRLTLAGIPSSRRIDEMEFILPVALDGGRRLTSERLAAVLQRHGGPAARYADRVRGLGFGALRGYLRGFIDLTFEHEGRWYVADYKSNWLGEGRNEYAGDGLWSAMAGHHYVLQYLLYLVALHRFLRVRLPGYDAEQHLGGAYYLFLRGMDPSTGPARGVFEDRPPAALIRELSSLFEGEDLP